MSDMRNGNKVFVERPERKRPPETTLGWILGKYGGKMWIGCIWLRIRSSGGLLWKR
jgi:hypothetical protein